MPRYCDDVSSNSLPSSTSFSIYAPPLTIKSYRDKELKSFHSSLHPTIKKSHLLFQASSLLLVDISTKKCPLDMIKHIEISKLCFFKQAFSVVWCHMTFVAALFKT